MNRNQSVMSSASEKNSSQPDQELLNMISDWKSKTRVGKFDRIKKMVFSFNQRPTDFKPADFFPPIPDLEIASDSEEKTIDKLDRERKSLSKRKLDYENVVEIDQVIENQATPEKTNGSFQNDNEKQRRQPVSNEFTDLKQFSPINSPTQTNRNLIKLNRESLLKQIQNDENLQSMCDQHPKNSDDKELNISLKTNSIIESKSKLNSSKNPTRLSNFDDHDEPIQKSNFSSVNKDESSSVNKSKSDQQIEAQLDKENIVAKSSDNNELNLFNPPTPPQAQSIQNHQQHLQTLPTQSATRSSITITKRRSAEPVRDILVDLSNVSAKPKVLNKQKAVTKFNESMNESQTELLMSQSNTYIRRKSTFNNKTSNSTVNSSASVLFKPVKSNKAKDLINLPQAPLFTHEKQNNSREHETSSENSSSLEIKRKKVRNKKTTKQKQQQKLKENDSKNSDAIDSTNKEQKESKTNTNDKEKYQVENECKNLSLNNEDLISEKQVVIEQIETNQKSTENRKKSSKNNDNDNNDDDVTLIDKSCSKVQFNQQTSPLIKTKNILKQQKKNKTDSSPKKSKNTKSRQPLKNIQNQEEKVRKTRANSQKEIGYFLNNKTVPYEQKLIDECENETPLSLRRSKRAKIDKNSQPIYGYEEISDYMGNKCIVRKVIGTKDKINIKINKELMRINHHFTETNNKKPKEKNKKTNRKNLDKTQTKISDAFKKLEKTQENLLKETNNQINHDLTSDPIEEPNRPDHLEANRPNPNLNLGLPNPVINDEQQVNVNLIDQDNILQVENSALHIEESLSISVNSNVNSSMEFIFSKKDGTTIPINPYFFHKNIEKKNFQHYSKGVQISPISDMTGVLRINGLSSTKTNYHDFAVNYFVQNGSFLFSLNGILSIHHEKDVIYIPKNTPYKIKNVSDNEDNFAYVYFRFEN